MEIFKEIPKKWHQITVKVTDEGILKLQRFIAL